MIDKRQFIGKYCDIQTKDGVWRLGAIEGKREDKEIVEVSLDGWSSNKNQKICLHSNRLQPPRFFSKGYTGQKTKPLRNFNFDMQQISHIVNWLKLFHNFDFQNMPILDITNLFRCQMFILVDSIMFHPWSINEETLEKNLKKIEGLFRNIVQIAILYIEKLPKFISQIERLPYERHSYLQSIPMSYLEASYELIHILKSIFNLQKRTEFFFESYSKHFNTNFMNEFIDLGFINLSTRLLKEFHNNKIFTEKFYLIANLLDLNLKIVNKSQHQKLNKSNQVKHMNEIINFLIKENFVELINKHYDDADVKSLIESFEEFSKNNRNFVEESQKFNSFLQSISITGNRYSSSSTKENVYKTSEYNLHKYFSQRSTANINLPQFSNTTPDYLNKLLEIETKLSKLEEKFSTPHKNSNFRIFDSTTQNKDKEFQRTTEFNIISPIKERIDDDLTQTNLLINPKESYFTVSDPFDEHVILSLIQNLIKNEKNAKNFENFDKIYKIINWRKKILEISKNNGWVVGKILAYNTVKSFEIRDSDIIEANLTFMDKFNILEKKKYENYHLEIDYKELLTNYEKELVNSLNI